MQERNQDGYQALGWIINKSEYGLFLVVAEEPIQQEIADVYRGGMIGVYDYKRYPGEYSFQILKEWIDGQTDIQTFFILNFQFALQSGKDINRLNFSRDMLTQLRKNLIFFTTPYGDDRLAAGAYYFYSFLKLRILFHNYVDKKGLYDSAFTLETAYERTGGEGTEARQNSERPENTRNAQKQGAEGEIVKKRLQEAYSLVQQSKESCDKAEYQESVELLLKAAGIYESILGTEHLETAAVYRDLAYLYERLCAYEQAEEWCNKSLAVYERNLGVHPDTADNYNILARIYESRGIYDEAEKLYQKAIHIGKELLGAEHPNTIAYCHNLAGIYAERGRYKEAEELYKQGQRLSEKALGEKHSRTTAGYNDLALIYLKQGRYREAEELLIKTLAIEEELGDENLDIAVTYNNMASVYTHQKRYAEAEELYQKVISIYESILGENNPRIASAYNNLAGLYMQLEKFKKAENICKRVVSIYEELFDGKHPRAAIAYSNLAYLYEKQGKYAEAEEWYIKALSLCEALYGENHPETVKGYCNLADLYEKQGAYEKAGQWYHKALPIAKKILGKNHDRTKSISDKLTCLHGN